MERMMYNEISDEVLNGFKEADSIVKNRIAQLEEENKKLKEENEELKEAMKELNNYNKFRMQENENLKEKIEKMEYGNSLVFDDVERICNEKLQLKEENKKLSEENGQLRRRIKEHCNTQTLADYKQRFERK